MGENKTCASYLGVYVAERVLKYTFKDVKAMPYGNPGYDVVCNRDKKIDIKCACLGKNGQLTFHIRHNKVADFFLCIAFDNRKELNPIHVWLIPGKAVNHLKSASIRLSTVPKWDRYKLDTERVSMCCDVMKGK